MQAATERQGRSLAAVSTAKVRVKKIGSATARAGLSKTREKAQKTTTQLRNARAALAKAKLARRSAVNDDKRRAMVETAAASLEVRKQSLAAAAERALKVAQAAFEKRWRKKHAKADQITLRQVQRRLDKRITKEMAKLKAALAKATSGRRRRRRRAA